MYQIKQRLYFAVGEDRAPRITEHPADILVRKNEPVTLGCHAEGLPQPTLRWYKDSRPLDPEGRHPLVLPAGGLFFLRVVPGKDQGVYWCEASNRAGLVRSRNATLSIAGTSVFLQYRHTKPFHGG